MDVCKLSKHRFLTTSNKYVYCIYVLYNIIYVRIFFFFRFFLAKPKYLGQNYSRKWSNAYTRHADRMAKAKIDACRIEYGEHDWNNEKQQDQKWIPYRAVAS